MHNAIYILMAEHYNFGGGYYENGNYHIHENKSNTVVMCFSLLEDAKKVLDILNSYKQEGISCYENGEILKKHEKEIFDKIRKVVNDNLSITHQIINHAIGFGSNFSKEKIMKTNDSLFYISTRDVC